MEKDHNFYCIKLITGETLLAYVNAELSTQDTLVLVHPMRLEERAGERASDYRIWFSPWGILRMDGSAYYSVSTFSIISFFMPDSRFIKAHQTACEEYGNMSNIAIESLIKHKSGRVN